MIVIRDKETGADLGTITEEQLQTLVDVLEEEFEEDRDYYINPETVDLIDQNGGDPALVNLLRRAIGNRQGAEIEWSRV
jgi:hypothetical protein